MIDTIYSKTSDGTLALLVSDEQPTAMSPATISITNFSRMSSPVNGLPNLWIKYDIIMA